MHNNSTNNLSWDAVYSSIMACVKASVKDRRCGNRRNIALLKVP